MEEAVEIGISRSFRLASGTNDRIAAERVRGTISWFGSARFDRHLEPTSHSATTSSRALSITTRQLRNFKLPLAPAPLTTRRLGSAEAPAAAGSAQSGSNRGHCNQAAVDVAADIRTNYVQALRSQQQVEADGDYLRLLDGLIVKAQISQPSTSAFLAPNGRTPL